MQTEVVRFEKALEAFAVSLWRSSAGHDNTAEWVHAYDELSAVERYLNYLRVAPVRELAGDLRRLAALRAEMSLPRRRLGDGENRRNAYGGVLLGMGG